MVSVVNSCHTVTVHVGGGDVMCLLFIKIYNMHHVVRSKFRPKGQSWVLHGHAFYFPNDKCTLMAHHFHFLQETKTV